VGQLRQEEIYTLTDADVQRMSAVELGGPALVQWDNTGNDSVLPSRNARTERQQILFERAKFEWIASKLFTQETQQALGTFVNYTWTYAQVSSDADFLPWATAGGSRPSNDGQILLFVGGQLIKGYVVSATGITLSTALVEGKTALATILSPSLATTHTDLVYRGSTGSGAGHKTWAIHNLDTDIYGTVPTVPTTTAKCFVFLNGLRRIEGVGVSITVGSGTCTVQFLEDVPGFEVQEDDYVTFLIWRA
jgi:hypothetical protein